VKTLNSVKTAIRKLSSHLNLMTTELAGQNEEASVSDASLLVHTDYGYGKFYLNEVQGSYDMSLQSLINFMLQEHNHYKRILSESTYLKVCEFNSAFPRELYDFSENEDEQYKVDTIEHTIVCSVRNSCERHNFSTEPFIEAGYDTHSSLPHISKHGIVGEYITLETVFLSDLERYVGNAKLSEDDATKLVNIIKDTDLHADIASVLYESHPSISNHVLRDAILHCKKKSECTILSSVIKRCGADEELLSELAHHKQSL